MRRRSRYDGRRLRFGRTPGRRRRSLESGAPPEAYAHHVAVSAHTGDEDAVAVLAGAASGVRARAPASAARWYEDALRLPPKARRPAGASCCRRSPTRRRQRDGSRMPMPSWRPRSRRLHIRTEVRERVGLTVTRARFEHLRGSLDAAHARLEAALADLPGDADAEELALVITLAVARLHRR